MPYDNEASALPSQRQRFWPFESMPRLAKLDGSLRTNRLDTFRQCNFKDDFEVAAAWLRQYESKQSTHRVYRGVLDALFNWANIYKEKAVSALTVQDFAEFDRYLASPHLWDSPAPRGYFVRGDPGWRPVASPRAASTRRATLSAIRSLATWMMLQGYASVRVTSPSALLEWSQRGASRDGVPIRPKNLSIDSVCWTVLQDSLDAALPTELWARRRALVGMLFYAGLNVEEARTVNYLSLQHWSANASPHVVVPGRSEHGRDVVYLCAEALDSLRRWFDAGPTKDDHDGGTGLLGSRDRCLCDVKAVINAAKVFAEERGWAEISEQLARYGARAFFHALPRLLPSGERIVWELTGATRENWHATYEYLPMRGRLDPARYRELCDCLSAQLATAEVDARKVLR